MGVSGVYKRMPTIYVQLVTEKDTFSLQTNTAEQTSDAQILSDDSLVEQVISFNTENDMSNDTPVFSVVLAGLQRWDRILQPNDIVVIKVSPGDGNAPYNETVMVGMISEVKKLGSYGDNSIIYQVSGQSMAKALMQLKLGTLQEIASITQSFGWMTGIGTTDQKGNTTNPVTKVKPIKTVSAKIVGMVTPASWVGYKDIDGNAIKPSEDVAIVSKKLGIKNGAWVNITGYGYVKARVASTMNFFTGADGFSGVDSVVFFSKKSTKDEYNKKYKKGVQIKEYDTKKNPETIEKESIVSNSGGTKNESGLMFASKTAAEVVDNIMRWFFNLAGDNMNLTSNLNNTVVKYNFNNERATYGDWIETSLESRAEDEMLLDPVPLMSFTGSLRQLITQAQAKPYNEFFTDFTPDGKARFVMRPTPFEPDEWKALQGDAIPLDAVDIIEETLSRNDSEVYSVFSSSIPSSITLNSVSDLMMYPVYFPGLVKKYGYSMLEQQNDYIFRSEKDTSTSGGSDKAGGSMDMASGDAKTNAKNIANALKKAGASGTGIAALLGTMQGESQLIPGTIQSGQAYEKSSAMNPAVGGYGFGLAQWDSGRRVNLLKFAESQNKKWDNLGLQLSFLLDHDGSDSNLIKELLVSKSDPSSIAGQMVTKWERPRDPVGQSAIRAQYAQAWYKELQLSSVTGESKIDTSKIGIGKTLGEAMGNKNTNNSHPTLGEATGYKNPSTSNKTVSEAIGNKGKQYQALPDVMKDIAKKKAEASAKKKKEKAKIDADNVNLAKKYSVYLANWYGNNNSFISGEIRVVGHPDYRVGNILIRSDVSVDNGTTANSQYTYYIESVSHEFSYTGGYTTVLGVTRGLPASVDRFATWNSSDSPLSPSKPGNGGLQLFTGGLFGELSIGKLADKGFTEMGKDGDGSNADSAQSDGKAEASSGSGDDYPSKWRDAVQDSLIDDWLYYNRECVSFVAWRLSQKKKFQGKSPKEVPFYHLGNAWDWNSVAGTYAQSEPKAGDVALFSPGTWGAGPVGHVAYVSKVDGDNVYIEDYNAGNPAGHYHTHTITKNTPTKYLRF